MKRSLFAALAGCAVLVAGCSGSGGVEDAPASDSSFAGPAVASAPDAGRLAPEQAPGAVERKEVVTGQIFVTADDPIAAARDAVALVEDAGGRVDNRTENPSTDNAAASSSLIARIPVDDLTATVDRISALGKVTGVSIGRDDVTMQYQDLDARIAALQSSVDRLRALIAQASNTADLIEAESALSSRQGELDSLMSQRNYLADQVQLSTITVQFDTDDVTPSPGPDSFTEGLVAGWHSLLRAVQDGIVGLGRAIPWVGALAIGAAVVYPVIRLVRSRTASHPKPAPTPAQATAPAEAEPENDNPDADRGQSARL
ncbi:MAG: DUF4349 domain-containing protein [Rhodococcus sp. (in: high G+C Gram-positive bacteria)]